MFSYFEKLRKAPVEERRKVAATYTVIIVVLIGLVWLVTLGFKFGALNGGDAPKSSQQNQNSGIQAPYK